MHKFAERRASMAAIIFKKQISMPEKDEDVFRHLKAQPDASKYIVRLVRADMENGADPREEMRKIAAQIYKEMRENERQ
jgi:hypothetical protein